MTDSRGKNPHCDLTSSLTWASHPFLTCSSTVLVASACFTQNAKYNHRRHHYRTCFQWLREDIDNQLRCLPPISFCIIYLLLSQQPTTNHSSLQCLHNNVFNSWLGFYWFFLGCHWSNTATDRCVWLSVPVWSCTNRSQWNPKVGSNNKAKISRRFLMN